MATLREIYNTEDPNYSPANIPGAVKRPMGGYEIPLSEMAKLEGTTVSGLRSNIPNVESRLMGSAPRPLFMAGSDDFSDITPFGGATETRTTSPYSARYGQPSAPSQPKSPTGYTQTTRTVYEGDAPKYAGPEYDEGKIKSIARKLAGPSIRRARLALSKALNQYYENPAMRGIVVRQALEGYGISVEQARASAYGQAQNIYGQQYQAQAQEAFRTYQSAMNAYRSTAKQITEQRNLYGGSSGGTGSRLSMGSSRPELGIA